MHPQNLWKSVLGEVETKVSPTSYKTIFIQSHAESLENGVFKIVCKNPYVFGQLKKYKETIEEIARKITKENIEVEFTTHEKPEDSKEEDLPLFSKPKGIKEANEKISTSPGLFEKYTFDKFIVGNNNRLAHAVAIGIADNPGKVYNPFFLHAGVGLGKTHLIQAIGNEILKKDSKAKVVYCTAESFMNELIETIQEGRNKNYTANKFRNKFRKADVLLIDDIQFIAGRGESTQEEFFHTFNALYMAQKQIVLTSDRPPKELSKLDQRITSRFASGMVSDIQPPDLETKSAILRNKRNEMHIEIRDEVINYIAETTDTNIRELEGTFLQIITQARAEGIDLTKEFVAKILGKVLKEKPQAQVNDILKMVCTYYSVKVADLKGKRRNKELVIPRHISMYLLKELTGNPLVMIGDILGGRDHTTIMHGVDKIEKEIKEDSKLKQDILNIKKSLEVSV